MLIALIYNFLNVFALIGGIAIVAIIQLLASLGVI